MKWKSSSGEFLSSSGTFPWFTAWALVIILLLCAWRKIVVRRDTFTVLELIISSKILPGPTEGNWSTSPTKITILLSGIARSKECIKEVSIIDDSSIIKTSSVNGSVSSCKNNLFLTTLYSSLSPTSSFSSSSSSFTIFAVPNKRWIVEAGLPVASCILLEALPVGAAKATVLWYLERI